MTEESALSHGEALARAAAMTPDRTAILLVGKDGGETALSYAELDRWIDQVARTMQDRGVRQGQRAAIALPTNLAFFIAVFATWRLGGCVVPIKHDQPDWDFNRMMNLIEPVLFVGDRSAGHTSSLTSEEIKAARAENGPAVENHVPQPVWAICSGGSTGKPKLIVNLKPGTTAEQFANLVHGDHAIQLITSPPYHTQALSLMVMGLVRGDMLIVMQQFDAERAVSLIERFGVNIMGLVPAMSHRIQRLLGIETRNLSSLKMVIAGGGATSPAVAQRWIDLVGADHLLIGYGASENIGGTSITGDELIRKPGSVGNGVSSGTEIHILGRDGEILAPGEVGDIYLRRTSDGGPLFQYVGAEPPPVTADGFSTVGDIGWLDEDGYLYIADRRSDMIKTGGVNVFPAEVEAALLEHPEVSDVAVIGLPDEEWGRRVHAIVVPADHTTPPVPATLREYCKSRLAAAKAPQTFEFVDALPRTDVMKLNRSALVAERESLMSQ